MIKKKYFTLDSYYGIKDYNRFISSAKNNNIEFEEFINIKPPHNRYIMVDDEDVPKFIDYDLASKPDTRWLIAAVKPTQPNELYYLERREGQDISYFNYILPQEFKNMHNEDYICIFKGWDSTEINNWSKLVQGVKIYKWGEAIVKGYKIYVCFNPYISGIIPSSRKLLEYDNNLKLSKKSVPKIQGMIEYELNHFVLIQEKLINKTYLLEYHLNGYKVPLKVANFM